MTIESDPPVYRIVCQGQVISPMRASELSGLDPDDYNLYLDLTRAYLRTCHVNDGETRVTDLSDRAAGGDLPIGVFGSVLEVLQVLAENPGQRFTTEVLEKYIDRLLEPNTLAKYIKRLRDLVGDDCTSSPFIRTDRRAPASISARSPTYFLDPALRVLVVSYA